MKPFKVATGLMGSTEPQKVTPENIHLLPAGSTVMLKEIGDWLIHLHDGIWLRISGCLHCYDRVERFHNLLDGAMVSHIPNENRRAAVSIETAQELAKFTSHKESCCIGYDPDAMQCDCGLSLALARFEAENGGK